jgi:uncharacterized protein (DUF111 family)
MRIAYFDCFSGASGNMILGALVDAGVPVAALEEDLHRLNLPGWQLKVTKESREAITGTHVEVAQTTSEHVHHSMKPYPRRPNPIRAPATGRQSAHRSG